MERAGSVAAGFSAVSNARVLVLLLTALTVVISLLAAAPLAPSLRESLAGTLAGDHLLKNHPSFAPTDAFDFLREKSAAVDGARAAASWAILIVILQQILFAGGIVSVLGKEAPVTLPEFVAGVRRNAWHNLKCFLIFLVTAGLSLGLWLVATQALRKRIFADVAPGTRSAFAFRIGILVVALLLYAAFSLLHDFARAARRSQNTIGAWGAYGFARRILAGRWLRALGVFLFWLLLGGTLLLLGVGIEWSAPAISAGAIALHILLQVAVLTIRPAIRIAAWGSYLALYDSAEPAVAPVLVGPIPPPSEPGPPPPLTLDDQPLI